MWLLDKLIALEDERALRGKANKKGKIVPFPSARPSHPEGAIPSELDTVRLRPYGAAALKEACAIVAAALPGTRNDTLFKQSLKMGSLVGAGALGRDEAEHALMESAPLVEDGTNDRFDESEAWRTIKNGLDSGEQNPRDLDHVGVDDEFPLNEAGNAERLVVHHQGKVRFVSEYGDWFTYTGTHWEKGRAGAVMEMREVLQGLYSWASRLGHSGDKHDRELAAVVRSFAVRSGNAARIDGALKLASAFPAIRTRKAALDPDVMKLNVANGTIDLRDGRLLPHDPADLITKVAPVRFDPQASCRTWERFVSEVMGGDAAMVAFLQRLVGYCLTGLTTEQKLFIFYGSGRNGKSVLLSVLLALLGDYGAETPASTLMIKRHGGGIPNDVARLERPHLVSANETDDGASLDESLIKSLTGGDKVTARFLHQEWFEFTPRFKTILRTNNLPRIKGQDEGIWRRLVPVPFELTIPEKRVDTHLTEKLLAESPGILNWAIEGCLEWQRNGGLGRPERLVQAWREYRFEEDTVSLFIASRHAIPESIGALAFHDEYVTFCQERRLRSLTRTAFGRRLSDLGWGHKEVKERGRSVTRRVPPPDLVRQGESEVWEEVF